MNVCLMLLIIGVAGLNVVNTNFVEDAMQNRKWQFVLMGQRLRNTRKKRMI